MAATIKFKRGTTDPTQLNAGEPAFNTNAKKFYIGHGTNVQTWVGAEIENTVANWATASNEKLATQSAIYNQFIDKSRASQSITGDLSVYNFNAADIEVDSVGLKDKAEGAIGYYEGEGANRAFFEKIKFSGTASNPGPDGTTNTINANNTVIIGSEVWLPSTISVGGSKVVMFGGAGEEINIGKPGTTSNNSTKVNVGSIGFWSRTVAPGSVAMKPFYSVRIQGPTDTLSEDLLFTLPNSYPTVKGDGSGTRPLVSDENGVLSWGEFDSETTTFNIADSSDNSAELNLVLTATTAAGQGSALIDVAAGTSGQDGGIKYNPSTNTLTTSVFRVREGTTAAYISIDAPTGTTSYSFTLPTTGGTADYVLKTDGSGNTSWTEVIEKANKVHVTDTPGTVGLNGFEAVYYPSFYEDSSTQSTNFYATRVDEKAYEVKPTRNRFTLKTGELPVGISRWTTCSTGAGNCQSGLLNPEVGGTGVEPEFTDSSGGGGTTDISGGGTTDSSGGGVTPGETGFDTPSSEDVGNFGVGELEFSARNLSTDVETGYLRFSINPALTQHISYVLPDTLPTPGQFLAVGETNFEKDSDLGDVRQLTWTNSAGEVNVAEATPDSSYNAAYSLVFAAGGGGGSKGLLFDLDNNDGGLSWNPSSNVLKAGRVQLDTGITESGGGTTTGAISLEPISSATGANVNLFASTTGTITLGASSAVVLVPSISVDSSDNAAVNKAYVDGVAAGIHFHPACKLATTGALPNSPQYISADNSANANGIGDKLQGTTGLTGALSIDGVTVTLGDRILVKDETAGNIGHNGIYTVTAVGASGVAWELTRATDFDTDVEIAGGDFTFVTHGTFNANSGWVQTTTTHTTIGGSGSPITFVQFAGAANYTASNGIRRDVNEFKLASGVNTDTSLTMGNILYGNGNYVGSLNAGTSTYVLQANGAAAPSWVEGPAKVGQTAVTVTNSDYYLTFTGTSSTGYDNIEVSSQLKYNPSGTYTAGTLNETNKHVLSIDSGAGYLDAIIDGGTYN